MTAITSFLDTVTAFTEGGPDFLRDTKIFTLNPHSIKPYRMPALLELFQLLRVAPPAFFRKNHRLLIRSGLMVDVAGDAIDPILCMFWFYPGLKEPWRPLLMAGDTEAYIDSLIRPFRRACAHGEWKNKDEEQQHFAIDNHLSEPHILIAKDYLESVYKLYYFVIPAKAGIQKRVK
jgi:hypothetical protein